MRRLSLVLVFGVALGCAGENTPVAVDAAVDSSTGLDTGRDTGRDTGTDGLAETFDALVEGGLDASDATDGAGDGLLADASDAPTCDPATTCIGAPMPTWELEDFQPKSPGFKTKYGLSAFKPKVTVVALLAAW